MDTDGHGYGEIWKLVLTAFLNHPCISESIRGSKKSRFKISAKPFYGEVTILGVKNIPSKISRSTHFLQKIFPALDRYRSLLIGQIIFPVNFFKAEGCYFVSGCKSMASNYLHVYCSSFEQLLKKKSCIRIYQSLCR